MSRHSLLQQVEFNRKTKTGVETKLTWVECSWGLKKGHKVRFEDEEKGSPAWVVVKVYKATLEAESIRKVWGLNLPKSQRTER